MIIVTHTDVMRFLSAAEPDLLANESFNNVILGVANYIAMSKASSDQPLFLSVRENEKILGHAMLSSPDKPLALSAEFIPEGLTALTKFLYEARTEVTGVLGPTKIAEDFAEIWTNLQGYKSVLGMAQGVYEAKEVVLPELCDGKLRAAEETDFETAKTYTCGFINDCFQDNKRNVLQETQELLGRLIPQRKLFFWFVNNEAVSMAAINRESRNGATISLVYTPPKHRGKGFGSCVTAKVTELALASGKRFCNLFTDLKNPTSNSIYQKIGYKFLGEFAHIKIEKC